MRLKLDENLGAGDSDRRRSYEHRVETVTDEHLTGASADEIQVADVRRRRSG